MKIGITQPTSVKGRIQVSCIIYSPFFFFLLEVLHSLEPQQTRPDHLIVLTGSDRFEKIVSFPMVAL